MDRYLSKPDEESRIDQVLQEGRHADGQHVVLTGDVVGDIVNAEGKRAAGDVAVDPR